ncbi:MULTISPECIES: SsrA-binding protein SmpB [unclassified Microbacterium]|uniref:SsrA-binding protein SmpB n=1 Tax=unclassified Microbacterium TaxID=2609290 RepID=UPI00097F08B4|nr:SsrA-binding protein SmpB [Microbacterium sp. JB110]RCS62715.1 SsrA-binding protein SmpB [Microbacterium sp. JB110]SJM63247.1 tmRNA-binding protein SmpB [Frigoribacterium sp. JB110]
MAKKQKKSAQDPNQRVIAVNRRARHEYTIEKTYEAGIMLQGTEVKSLREGHANLTDGYAYVDKGEAWLDQVNIPQYSNGTWTNHAAKRNRKLLLHKDEITKIGQKAAAGGYTLVPLKLYFVDGRAKVEIGIAKGKTLYDKRQTLRERQDKRDAERAMRTRNRMGE